MKYSVEVQVDEVKYTVNMMTASRSIRLLAKLAKILGEPLSLLAAGKGDQQKAIDLLPNAVKAIAQRMDEDQVESMIKELVGTCSIGPNPIQFETHFQGRIAHLFKLLPQILKVQYGDFWTALGDYMGKTPGAATE